MFTGVGERTREGNDLYHEMQETRVIQLDGESKVALVFGQMNEPPGARARVALTGLTVAEYFRDEEGQDGMYKYPTVANQLRASLTLGFSASLHRQHFPLHSGRFRSVCPAWPYPLRRRLPTHPRRGHGWYAGTYHHYHQGLHHLCASRLRARRRLD